jgi:hypothetical protein
MDMSGMQLYVKFMFTLGVGLVGLGIVLTTVLETLLKEWDAARDLSRFIRSLTHGRPHVADVSAEDILLELEKGRAEGRYQRRAPAKSIDRRREALRDLREAEQRLSAPVSPELV